MAKLYGLTELFDDDLVVTGGSIGIGINPDASLYGVQPLFHVAGESGPTFFVIQHSASSNAGGLIIQRSRGSIGSETATQNGDTLGVLYFYGYGVSAPVAGSSIISNATQNHTNSAAGTKLEIQTTPNNTTSLTTRMTIDQDGEVGIGTISPSATLHVVGDGLFSSQVTIGESVIDTSAVLKVRGNGSFSRALEVVTSSNQNALWVNNDETLFCSNGVGIGNSLVSPDTYGLQVVGGQFSRGLYTNISHTTADAYAAYLNVTSVNSNDNLGLYINSVNSGAGNAYAIDVNAGQVRLGDLTSGATAGYVLQTTDSNGLADWVDIDTLISGGGGIYGGSGTVPSTTNVAITNTLNFDTNTLFIDASNNRLGIGISSPGTNFDERLQITKSNAPSFLFMDTAADGSHGGVIIGRARGTSDAREAVQSGDNLGHLYFMTHGTSSYSEAASIESEATENSTDLRAGGNLQFRTTPNGTNTSAIRMTIDHDGEVGIGVNSPTALLHVDGTFRLSSLTTTPSAGYLLRSVDGLGNVDWVNSSTVGDGDGIYDGSGTIPVGTTTVTIPSFSTFKINSGLGDLFNVNADGEIVVNEGGGSGIHLRIEGDTDQNLFRTDAPTDRIGIGTSAPSQKLHVVGDVLTSGGIAQVENSATGYIAHPGGASFNATTNSYTGAIEITLPIATADMMSFWVDIFEYATTSNRGETISLLLGGYNSSTTSWANTAATIITSSTGKDYNVRFGGDGVNCKVWIGELASTWNYPQIKVRDFQAGWNCDINKYVSGWSIAFESTAFDTVSITRAGNLPLAGIAAGAGGIYEGSGTVPSSTTISTSNTTRWRIGAGSVPSTSSTTVLQIQNNLSSFNNCGLSILSYNNASSIVNFSDQNDEDVGQIRYTHSNNNMYFRTNTTDKMTIEAGGDVGIGVTNPSSKLHVNNGTSNATIRVDSSNPGDANVVITTSGLTDWSIGNDRTDGHLKFDRSTGVGAATRMYLHQSASSPLFLPLNPYTAGTGNYAIAAISSATGQIVFTNLFLNNASISDSTLKTNVVSMTASSGIMDLNPVTFDWIDNTGRAVKGKNVGLIAQEVEALIPEAVWEDIEDNKKNIQWSAITTMLIKKVQEQQTEIDQLRTDVDSLLP